MIYSRNKRLKLHDGTVTVRELLRPLGQTENRVNQVGGGAMHTELPSAHHQTRLLVLQPSNMAEGFLLLWDRHRIALTEVGGVSSITAAFN